MSIESMREDFESNPCTAVPDQYKKANGVYIYPAIQKDWENRQAACNWQKEQDAEICRICKRSYKFESERLNVDTEHVRGIMEGMAVCEEAIKSQEKE